MTWFKIDDGSVDHPKVLKAGLEAWGLFCMAGCWASKHLTDGFVPDHVATKLGRKKLWLALESSGEKNQKGLVERVECGWILHDFLDWNPPAEVAKAQRSARQEQAKKAALSRWAHADQHAQPHAASIPLSIDTVHAASIPLSIDTSMPCARAIPSRPVPSRPNSPIVPQGGQSAQEQPALDLLPSEPRRANPAMVVLDYWRAALMPDAKSLPKRLKRITARLKEGYTVEQLCAAVDGAKLDPWLMGESDGDRKRGWRDVGTVLRDGAQVERLCELARTASEPDAIEYVGIDPLDPDASRTDLDGTGEPPPPEFLTAFDQLTRKHAVES